LLATRLPVHVNIARQNYA